MRGELPNLFKLIEHRLHIVQQLLPAPKQRLLFKR